MGVIFGVAVADGVGVGVGVGAGIGEGARVGDGVKAGVGASEGDGGGVRLVALLPQPAASVPSNTRTSASVAISLIRYPPRCNKEIIYVSLAASKRKT